MQSFRATTPDLLRGERGWMSQIKTAAPGGGRKMFLTSPFIDQAITRTEASAAGEKARAYIRLFSSFRANHSNQGRRSGDVDAVTFATARNRAANGIQLEPPTGGNVFLHGAANARGQAVIDRLNMDRLDLGRVNFCAACFRDGTGLSHSGHQFAFPLRVRVNLPFVHT